MNHETLVKVFVYGTLRKGSHNHRCLNYPRVQFICKDTIRARMYTAHWGYPFIIFSQSNKDQVIGEIYEVPYSVLRGSLDRLEGYSPGRKDCLYFRKKARTAKGYTVFVYEASEPQARRACDWITHGDWMKAKKEMPDNRNDDEKIPNGIVRLDRAHKKWSPIVKPFDNEARTRYYGLRIGDKVSCRDKTLKQFPDDNWATVEKYGGTDNNRVFVSLPGQKELISCVAEWLTLEVKVEDRNHLLRI